MNLGFSDLILRSESWKARLIMVAPILSTDQPPFQTQLFVQVVYRHPHNLKSTAHTENVQYQQTDTTRYNQVQSPSDDGFDLSHRRQHETSIARLRKSHWSCTTVICIPHVMTTLASGHRASTTVVGSIQGHQICWAFAFRTGWKVHGRRCLILTDKGEPCLAWKESQTPAVRRPNSIESEVGKACCVIYMRDYIDSVLS